MKKADDAAAAVVVVVVAVVLVDDRCRCRRRSRSPRPAVVRCRRQPRRPPRAAGTCWSATRFGGSSVGSRSVSPPCLRNYARLHLCTRAAKPGRCQSGPRSAGHVDHLAGDEPRALTDQEGYGVAPRPRGGPARPTGICATAAFWKSSKSTPTRARGGRRHVGDDETGRDRVRGDAERPSSMASVLVKPCRPAFAAA